MAMAAPDLAWLQSHTSCEKEGKAAREGGGGGGGGRRGGLALAGSCTGVERKTNHRALKVPTWKAMRKCATSVKLTLDVKIRRNGRRWV